MGRRNAAPDISRYWGQPTLAKRLDVVLDTVYTWRTESLNVVRRTLTEAGLLLPDDSVMIDGEPVRVVDLTEGQWQSEWPRLRLPTNALPLPTSFVDSKPVWLDDVAERWGRQTGRVSPETGQAQRASSPGRPRGVKETKPRKRGGSKTAAA